MQVDNVKRSPSDLESRVADTARVGVPDAALATHMHLISTWGKQSHAKSGRVHVNLMLARVEVTSRLLLVLSGL